MPAAYLPLAPRSVALAAGGVLAVALACYALVPGLAERPGEGWSLAWAADTEGLSACFGEFGAWGPLVLVAAMVAQMFLIVFPSWVPMVVAVVGYGPVWGSAVGLTGVMLSSLIGYRVARRLGAERLAHFLGERRHRRLCDAVRDHGPGGVVLFRMSPFLATDAVSFIAGAVGMPLRRYLLATLAGTLPLQAAIAYFGRDLAGLKAGMWWIGGLGVAAYAIFVVSRRRRRRRSRAEVNRRLAPKRASAKTAGETVGS